VCVKWDDNIKVVLTEIRKTRDCIILTQGHEQWRGGDFSYFINYTKFIDYLGDCQLIREDSISNERLTVRLI
jgi:hypothetical protein